MSEVNDKKKESNQGTLLDDFTFNKLKTIDIVKLEKTIAEAISQLAEVEYTCEINDVVFGDFSIGKGAKMKIQIREKISLFKSD